VLDYSFPGHISGEELAHQLRAGKPDLPLIMLSGYPDLPDTAQNSVDILILKGAGGPAVLLEAVAKLLPLGKPPRGVNVSLTEQSQELMDKSQQLLQELRRSKATRAKRP
jgi:DNA-binding NarL/FixJ family response regulator